ncbi:MAG: chromate transporter [Bordetella sp.]|nr:chromate transporter [Bordetella sp.]
MTPAVIRPGYAPRSGRVRRPRDPLVEATKHDFKLSAALTAITAAVVGVILNLAVFFGYHTLWPQGLDAPPDLLAAAIAVAALVALVRFKRGPIEVVLVCGLAGVVARMAG